jgi:hypothetical protein
LQYVTDFLPQVDTYPPEKGYGAAAANIAPEHIWDVAAILEDEYGLEYLL